MLRPRSHKREGAVSDKKIVRIEIEYDNGDVERATGDDAAEIWRSIESAFVMQHIHGMTYGGPKLIPVARSGKSE